MAHGTQNFIVKVPALQVDYQKQPALFSYGSLVIKPTRANYQ